MHPQHGRLAPGGRRDCCGREWPHGLPRCLQEGSAPPRGTGRGPLTPLQGGAACGGVVPEVRGDGPALAAEQVAGVLLGSDEGVCRGGVWMCLRNGCPDGDGEAE